MKKGTLYLIPNTLGGNTDGYATELSRKLCGELGHFIVEEIKSARKLIRQLGVTKEFEQVEFYSLNEHTRSNDIEALIKPLLDGENVGLISEAGVPCVADPGSAVVSLAHENKIRVVPLSGPSSIIMALMASGFNGQQFTFNGYLPREKNERVKKIRQLEALAIKGHTQLFMDAPYRNLQVFEDLLTTCRMDTKLCVAANISCHDEMIKTLDITHWLMQKPNLNKIPVMFVLGK